MKKLCIAIALTTFLASSSFACCGKSGDMMDSPCGAVAKACKAAGFDKKSNGKKFWMDCMKPLLLGKEVKGVAVDAAQVKACREKKIDRMQKEIKILQDMK